MRIAKYSRLTLLAALFSTAIMFVLTGTAAAQTTAYSAPSMPAHASVTSAIPAIGSTISQAPTSVTVFTAENINPDPKVSNLFVYGPAGEATAKLISQGNAKVSFTNPKEMSVAIKPDPTHLNGVYVVHWITKSALDGDPDDGAFIFTVKSGAAATATPAATATAAGQTTTPTVSNTSGNSGTPTWLAGLIALAGLIIGLGAGIMLGRRGRIRPAVAESKAAISGSSRGAMRKSIEQEREETTKRP
jgi:copper resistance protein C